MLGELILFEYIANAFECVVEISIDGMAVYGHD